MSLPAFSNFWKNAAMSMLTLAASLFFGYAVHAQAYVIGIGASVINSDFSSSTASVVEARKNSYLIVFRVRNDGELTSENTALSLVLPLGWDYLGTSGTIDQVLVQDRAYGQLMELQLAPVGTHKSNEISVSVGHKGTIPDSDAFFAVLTSKYSVPIYVKFAPETDASKVPFWSSWFRSVWEYLLLLVNEVWSRFLFAVSYTSS